MPPLHKTSILVDFDESAAERDCRNMAGRQRTETTLAEKISKTGQDDQSHRKKLN